jgi:hypothetical protein
VTDSTAPTLTPKADKLILRPPNHGMVDVTIFSNASDNSGALPVLSATDTGNGPEDDTGDGDVGPDWTEPVIDPDNGAIGLQFRSERAGTGSGGIYTIVITAEDGSGNVSRAVVEVIVAHDKGK